MRFQKRKRIILVILLIFSISICVFFYSVIKNSIIVTNYKLNKYIDSPIRIVQLTDLHNREFGKNNAKLIAFVKKQHPDMIVMTGDMINADEEDLTIISNLIEQLCKVADIYYCYGNHEIRWIKSYGKELRTVLESAGAIVLDESYLDISVNDVPLRIGGCMGYYGAPHMMSHDQKEIDQAWIFMNEFEDTDRLKILLDHIPTSWVDWRRIDDFPVDIIFCGHYHGGIIQFPVINRGLYAPYVGWFPKNTKGIFEGEKGTCILSSGLGSEYHIPRINNRPEIVTVDLVTDE